MGKFLVAIIAGIGGFMLTAGLGTGRDASEEDSAQWFAYSLDGVCMRQMRQLIAEEERAQAACTCVNEGFAAGDYALTDAFGDDFDAMSRITRQCASRYGAVLPN